MLARNLRNSWSSIGPRDELMPGNSLSQRLNGLMRTFRATILASLPGPRLAPLIAQTLSNLKKIGGLRGYLPGFALGRI